MKAEAGCGINRAKTNHVSSYAMQKKSVPLKCKLKTAANQNISVRGFFPPYLMPCYSDGKLL